MTHTPAQIQQALDPLPRLQLNELPTPLHFCARLGLKGVVVLYQDENTPMGQRHRATGNYLLDQPIRESINLLARSEGILLDPAYTGKAFATLLAHLRQGRLPADEDVVFVHTGGTPLTFVYGEDLLPYAEK